ncbi:Zinc/iron permease [Morchella snyderi]|nr:Zinc/iron permease [Morchella snyderi]
MNFPTRDLEPAGKALVTRSTPVCGTGRSQDEEYNTGLHVMALFVVLAQSSLACAFPIIAKRVPWLRIPPSFLFGARHFGTGVLISTAFVHLLPTAFISLNDPCLPDFWNKEYPAMPGAIAMGAVFFVTVVEMLFTRGLCKGGFSESDHHEVTLELGCTQACKDEKKDAKRRGNTRGVMRAVLGRGRKGSNGSEEIGGAGGVGAVGFGMAGRRRSRRHSLSQGLKMYGDMGKDQQQQGQRTRASDTVSQAEECAVDEEDDDVDVEYEKKEPAESVNDAEPKPVHGLNGNLTPEQVHRKALLQVGLLEMGILFHSVFIGMALSVTGGPGFVVLLIAIVFHQTFEGLALGSRIAVLDWKPKAIQPWMMALAYGLTTPIGQAIGLATHTLYSPESQTGLLMVGVMNAISSGLLVFAGLVELLAEDFLSDESWNVLTGKKRVAACFLVFAGAFGMAFVGAFA